MTLDQVFNEVFSDTALEGHGEILARFAELGRLLLEANRQFNLTRITEPRELAERHFLEPFLVDREVDLSPGPVMDLGTGAGFPGLPLAILHPELSFTLVDGRAKKIAFVRAAIEKLGLRNVQADAKRGEEALRNRPHDAVLVRAVSPVAKLSRLLSPIRGRLGRLILIKGPGFEQEWARDRGVAGESGFCLDRTVRCLMPDCGENGVGRTLVVAVLRSSSDKRSG